MNGRLLAVLGAWAVLIPGFISLVMQESSLEPEEPVKGSELLRTPVMTLLSYTKDSRRSNLTEMGLTGEALEVAYAEITGLQARKAEIESIVRAADANNMAAAFCRKGVPVVYRAAFMVLGGDSARPQLVDLDRTWGKPWKLFPTREIPQLFLRWEQQNERKPEDTLMAVSALVLGATTQASTTPMPPWDKRSWEGGSFAAVAAVHDQVNLANIVGRYLGRVHFIAEIVQADEVAFGCRAEVKKPNAQ